THGAEKHSVALSTETECRLAECRTLLDNGSLPHQRLAEHECVAEALGHAAQHPDGLRRDLWPNAVAAQHRDLKLPHARLLYWIPSRLGHDRTWSTHSWEGDAWNVGQHSDPLRDMVRAPINPPHGRQPHRCALHAWAPPQLDAGPARPVPQ